MSPKNGSGNGNGHAAQVSKPVSEARHLFAVVADGGGKAHAVDICVFPSNEIEAFDIAAKYQADNAGVVGVYSLPFNNDPAKMHQTIMASKGVKSDLAGNRLTLTAPSSDPSRSPAASTSVEQHAPSPN